MQVHGYPNLFMTMGPLSPAAAFCNVPTCIQQQVDWIRDAIAHVRARGCTVMEATAEAEAQWVEHADSLANMTLVPKTQSWYMSGKANGKPRLLPYAGGVNGYKRECDAAKARGYDGFAIR